MSKLDDYEFKDVPQQIIDFKDDIRDLVNFGKYQFIVSTSAPSFTARGGEVMFYRSGTDGRMYVYMGTSWNLVVSFTADAA